VEMLMIGFVIVLAVATYLLYRIAAALQVKK
jgi:uncharacterized membrane protein